MDDVSANLDAVVSAPRSRDRLERVGGAGNSTAGAHNVDASAEHVLLEAVEKGTYCEVGLMQRQVLHRCLKKSHGDLLAAALLETRGGVIKESSLTMQIK